MSDIALLREVVNSFGAIKAVAVEEYEAVILSTVKITLESGELVISAVPDDDTVRVSLSSDPGVIFRDVSVEDPWRCLIDSEPLWIWLLTNQQGYTDGIQIYVQRDSFDFCIQLVTMASSLRAYLVERPTVS